MKENNKTHLNKLEYYKILELLAELAQTTLGKQKAFELKPLLNPLEIEQALVETEAAFMWLLTYGDFPLSAFKDIRLQVKRAASDAILTTEELFEIILFLRAVKKLQHLLQKTKQDPDSKIEYLIEQIEQLNLVQPLYDHLEYCLETEHEIADQASQLLLETRRKIKQVQKTIKRKLEEIVHKKAAALQETIITLREGRFVVPVKAEHKKDVPGILHDTSGSGATLFIEPLPIVELNNEIKVLKIKEETEVERILMALSEEVAARSLELLDNVAVIAMLDLTLAKGRLATNLGANRPAINQDGIIELKQARHPLIDPKKVVPIDFELGKSFTTLVITGPNTGGKTVSLKTCGLLCLMAMTGLFIPADIGSKTAIFSQVLVDIGDEQSIEQNLSTFSSHMKNIIAITAAATTSSLVLLDELGAGTDPAEGAALAIAILNYLRTKQCKIVATTHYKELKAYAMNTTGVENASCEFDPESLQPTYHLLIGVPGVSNAFYISQRLGLNDTIIAEGKTLLSQEGIHFEEMLQSIEKSHIEARKMRLENEALKQQTERQKTQLEEAEKQLKLKKQDIIQKAREEARDIYEEAQDEVEQLLAAVRTDIQQAKFEEINLAAKHQLSQKRHHIENAIGAETLAIDDFKSTDELHLQLGEYYYAESLGLTGKLIKEDVQNGHCLLQVDNMTVSINPAALRPLKKEAVKPKNQTRRKKRFENNQLGMENKSFATTEIKLLGQKVTEALDQLDQFLDQAILAGLSTVRIVHGKGTGALRKAVQEALKKDPRCRKFYLAEYGDGDSGVTIAELF